MSFKKKNKKNLHKLNTIFNLINLLKAFLIMYSLFNYFNIKLFIHKTISITFNIIGHIKDFSYLFLDKIIYPFIWKS